MVEKKETKKKSGKKEELIKPISKEKVEEDASKRQLDKSNKTLFWILIFLGFILIAFLGIYTISETSKKIEYKGVEFLVIKEGNLRVYNTYIPIYTKDDDEGGKYNFYLRTNPKELEKIKFESDLDIMKFVTFNYSTEIDGCGVDVLLAVQNMINLYEFIGTKVYVEKNGTCHSEGKYTLINLEKSDENKIEEISKNCYTLKIKDCEVFPTTERFMLEIFSKVKEKNIRIYD